MSRHPSDQPLLVSAIILRRAIGIIGIALPFVLPVGTLLLAGPDLPSSVSAYYYSIMRDVLVGSLCAIGVFLWAYRGYSELDDIVGSAASVAVIGVALFPTAPPAGATPQEALISTVHYLCAAVFLSLLAFFCLKLFVKTDKARPTRQKLVRNRIYRACGVTIVACIVLIAAVRFVPHGSAIWRMAPVYWLETIAVVAFGLSWLTKGETIFRDEGVRIADVVGVAGG